MIQRFNKMISRLDISQSLFAVYAGILLLSVFTGIATRWYFLAGVPAALLLVYVALVDFKKVFYLLMFFIPLSTEIHLPNGLGTDLPTEPLTVGLMIIFGLYVLSRPKSLDADFITHPITLLLLLHIGWTYAASFASQEIFVSVKFSLAKTWYVAVFFFMT